MTLGEPELEAALEHAWETPHTLWGALTTVDHKKIGTRYLATAVVFLVVGGLEALVMRLQLLRPDQRLLGPEAYDQLFTMHGTTMILWYAAPILSGFGNYLVPLWIGARDMAFPRLNAFSYWMFLLSGIFLYSSVALAQAPDAGWFAYVPLASRPFSPGYNLDFYALANIALTISTTAGAINFIATILGHRCPGMHLSRMPLPLYSTLTSSALSVLALPALTVACIFLYLDRRWGTHFFDLEKGGEPLLWQHLFWFFGHPWVYIVFLPATGFISMIIPTVARRAIVGQPFVAAATVLTGIVGMGVWVHHMFAVGMNHMAMSFFAAASMTISLFSAIQFFAWIATLATGRPVRTTALWFSLGFLATFAVGGLSGVITAIVPFDWQVHDSYFVVAHLHYVLIGANVFPVFAAFYHWLPKITGRMLDERVGKASFWLMFIGFNVGFFPMHISGLLGMRRRVFTFALGDQLGWLNFVSTMGVLVLTLGVLASVLNFFVSLRRGAAAGDNPWNAESLEWATSSPPRSYAFAHIPTVRSPSPLWDTHDPFDDPEGRRTLLGGRRTLASTSVHARPRGVTLGVPDSIVPLVTAVAIHLGLAALIPKTVALTFLATLGLLGLLAAWLWPRPRTA
jgi:cytochrome c oxidase subunit I